MYGFTVYTQIFSDLTDRSLGRHIFEDFRALHAQANFHSNFGKSPAAPKTNYQTKIKY